MKIYNFCEEDLKIITENFIKWFNEKGRKFPWRTEKNKYKIFVTELLLQRTKADSVKEIYDRFFNSYPSMQSIATSKIEEFNKYFSKLGLKYRAERLKEIAIDIIRFYDGKVPCDMQSLFKYKGIGVYIASAIINFGCDCPKPVVDKNVLRLLNRLCGIKSEIKAREFIFELYKYGNHQKIAYSLIDIGSLICNKTPKCKICPIINFCQKKKINQNEWRMLRKVKDKDGNYSLREQYCN